MDDRCRVVLFVCLSTPIFLSVYLVCLSICLEVTVRVLLVFDNLCRLLIR